MGISSLNKSYFICGGAGFIGSHFADALLADPETEKVTIYDNFSSGRHWHYEHHSGNSTLGIIKGDIENTKSLSYYMSENDTVIHLASNPDIAKAVTEPSIDFYQGTALTNSVVEAMRISGAKRLLYASGSGVYGDIGRVEANESTSLEPISTYGASKLAGEALIRSYCYMFDITACAFRFGNVVGARQTHGVGLDFTKQLFNNPKELKILGNGKQSKSYIHVSDVVSAVLLANKKQKHGFNVFNVATKNYITVNKIAKIVQKCLDIENLKFTYTGGDRGWKGDIPIVRLNTSLIRKLGWNNKFTTEKAIEKSILDMLSDIKLGRI